MTRELLNTLFVTTPDAYVRLDHDTLKVEAGGDRLAQVPLHHLGAVMLFGNAMISPQAIHRCAAEGRAVNFMDYAGRFKARVTGPTSGNVLLRQAQYEAHRDDAKSREIARACVAGKIRNMHQAVSRAAREAKAAEDADRLRACAQALTRLLATLKPAAGAIPLPNPTQLGEERATEREDVLTWLPGEEEDGVSELPSPPELGAGGRMGQIASTDAVRGVEGQAAALYFEVFGAMIAAPADEFSFRLRTRRPPRDRVNALLSFVYALLAADCTAACEGVGLDPQFGFLHVLRPGRASLALDLMEEFRPCLADRLVLTLINRRQIRPEHFAQRDDAGGSVLLTEAGRKIVLTAYQTRKQEEVLHALLKEKAPFGLLPHLQARLLARHLRGDLESYLPFTVA